MVWREVMFIVCIKTDTPANPTANPVSDMPKTPPYEAPAAAPEENSRTAAAYSYSDGIRVPMRLAITLKNTMYPQIPTHESALSYIAVQIARVGPE